MCLKKDENQTHKVAEKDITCYKLLKSPYSTFDVLCPLCYPDISYFLGKESEPNVPIDVESGDKASSLAEGVIHSYQRFSDLDETTDYYLAKQFGLMNDKVVVAKCTIPKGTPYWENYDHTEYASLKIVIDSLVLVD